MVDEINERDDMFFIEFKIQDKNGEKYKFKTIEDFKRGYKPFYKLFNKNIDYCKFDFVVLMDGIYVELSSIYVFNKDELDYDELKKSLSSDMIDLINEGKYYKSLKRLFALYKLYDPINKEALVDISQLFNSMTGELYQHNSILKAIQLMKETYNDKDRLDNYVFHNLGYKNIDDIDNIVKDFDKLINREGLNFYKVYYPDFLKNKDINTLVGGNIMGEYLNAVFNPLYFPVALKRLSDRKGGNKQTGSLEFSSQNLPRHMIGGYAKGLIYQTQEQQEQFLKNMENKQRLTGGIFDGTEGMSGWEGFKYGFQLPFKALKEINKVIPLSMLVGMGQNTSRLSQMDTMRHLYENQNSNIIQV